jgi:hypothetical protein
MGASGTPNQAERTTSAFDYTAEAALFCSKTVGGRHKPLMFKRFTQAAEAIRYAIEELPAYVLGGCALEVDEERYFGKAIRPLYESVDFPLKRRAKQSA